MPLNFLSRDDIFISYSRQDGALYSVGLADKLTEKGFSCFIDKLGTQPNHDLPDSLKKKIRNCTVFVLVGTDKAAQSKFVAKEITEFKKTGRTFLPVDFNGSVANASWYQLIPGIATESESNPEALVTGNPSRSVLNFIEKSFAYTRRNQRMFRMFLGALTLFLVLSLLSVVFFFVARTQLIKAAAAGKLAHEKTLLADEMTLLADEKTLEAKQAADLAHDKTAFARTKTIEAERASTLAIEKTHAAEVAQAAAVKAEDRRRIAETKARAQELIASSRDAAATSLSLLPFDPEESLKEASKAYGQAPTTQAADALRKSLFESHIHSVLRGHEGIVWDATFDSASKMAVTSSRDGTVRVWDVLTGSKLATLSGTGPRDLSQVKISSNGQYVAAAAADQQATMFLWKSMGNSWDGKALVLRGIFNQVAEAGRCSSVCSIRTVAFSPDSRHVAAAGADGVVWVWATDTGDPEGMNADHKNGINQLMFSPDGKQILSAGADDQALLWEWEASPSTNNPRRLAHNGPVVSAQFSGDGNYILTAWNKPVQGDTFVRTEGGEAWVWQNNTGECVAKLVGHVGALTDAKFNSGGEFVVTASDDTTARVWRWQEENLRTFPMILRGHTGGLHGAEFSPDGHYVVTSSVDGTARIWKPETNRHLAEQNKQSLDIPSIAVLRGHSADLWQATYSRDGQYVLTASEDQTARVWNAQVENIVATLPEQNLVVQGVAFNPEATLVATTTAGYQPVRLWDWRKRELIAELRLSQGARFRSPIFSPDGKFVAAVMDNIDGDSKIENAVAVWEWGPGESRCRPILLTGHRSTINSLAFSHDSAGRFIVTASGAQGFDRDGNPRAVDNAVRIYDRSSEDGLHNPVVIMGHKDQVNGAVFNSDDRYVIWASSDGVRVWDWQTEAGPHNPIILNGATAYGFSAVAISSDNEYIVAAGGGLNVAAVWRWLDPQLHNQPVVLRGHTGAISTVAFSPSSAVILTSGKDGTDRLWDARTGQMISILSGHDRGWQTSSFSGDGRLVVTTDHLTARIYSCDVCAAANTLMALVPEHLSLQTPGGR